MIYVNCCLRYEYESDLRSNKHYLSSSENRAWKKFRPVQDFLWIHSIVKVMSLNPVQMWIFSGLIFTTA